jgi:hypothetical protein
MSAVPGMLAAENVDIDRLGRERRVSLNPRTQA